MEIVEYVWSEYEGQVAGTHPLQSYLGVRHGRAFFVTDHEGAPALLQVTASSVAQHEIWREALHLSHPHLMPVYTMGEATVGQLPVTYAVGPLPDDDLSEILPKRVLTDQETQQISLALNNALDYLHGRNLASGAVLPDNIFAVRDQVKLGMDTLHVGGDLRADRRQLEATLIEIRTGTRPGPRADSARVAAEPEPSARLSEPRTPRQPLKVERSTSDPTIAEPEPVQGFPRQWLWAGAAIAAAALMVFTTHRGENAAIPNTTLNVAPSPVATQQTIVPRPSVPRAQGVREGYAVIVAAYRNGRAAEQRSADIGRRWPKFQPKVLATSDRRYLVALGSGLSKKEARRLHIRARSGGLPRDVYVTKF